MESSSFPASFTKLRYPFSETLLSKRENFPVWIKCYTSLSSTKNAAGTLLYQAGFRTWKWSLLQVSCSREREIYVIEAGCMDDIYDALAEHLVPTAAATSSPDFKHIVGLAGPPGAGKSTVASEVAKRVNKLWPQKSPSFDSQVEPPEVAIVLPIDGFHLYRYQLEAMEDLEKAHARWGESFYVESAPWTFDPNLLLECLKTLKDQGSVYCPSFDHGVGDPIEDDIFVYLQHKIVIVEGNYLLLGDGAWKEVSSMFDEKW